MSFGTNLIGLAMLDRAQSDARQSESDALYYAKKSGEGKRELNEYIFRAKSHVHGLRVDVHSHRVAEDKLIAALKAENANHPLASREAVDNVVEQAMLAGITDPAIVKKTYPDGRLPKGTWWPDGSSLLIDNN